MSRNQPNTNLEKLTGIVERVTYHNPTNGWSVLKVSSFREPGKQIAVVIHQAKVFAGATMEFWGAYTHHPKHGEQFKAVNAIEKKPATTAALEKYLGSGLIKGIGPAIAQRIVKHFADQTLAVFDGKIDKLKQVPGIADKKLELIRESWEEHKAVREVMIFLQNYGVSPLFATKIYKTYGDQAIGVVSENPYRLASDIYGIGFFSADQIALAMNFERQGPARIAAGILHVLASSREEGHCYLREDQIVEQTPELLREKILPENIMPVLEDLLAKEQIRSRKLRFGDRDERCIYSKKLYFEEVQLAQGIAALARASVSVDRSRVANWIDRYCAKHNISLSEEQRSAVIEIAGNSFSILTGGPGCGKTTTTRVLVQLLLAMKKQVLLAAPTGRASQRMTEVIGVEAKTIHRLLEWNPQLNGFKKNAKEPLDCQFLIVDECSMLDTSLANSLVNAVPDHAQVLFIGDPDQLPAVGAGNVLGDLLRTPGIARSSLTKIFRQAESSSIIRFAHDINSGRTPKIVSPIALPSAFQAGNDCLFVDADEMTQDQMHFVQKIRSHFQNIEGCTSSGPGATSTVSPGPKAASVAPTSECRITEPDELYTHEECDDQAIRYGFQVPEKFQHVDVAALLESKTTAQELHTLLKTVHPWSTVHYGMTALDSLVRIYQKTVPEWLPGAEIQVLTPQVRGSLGTHNLNIKLQGVLNPPADHKSQLLLGEKIFRVGDRVIQTRNNYNLNIFNGDIGVLAAIDPTEMTCKVNFGNTSLGNKAVTVSSVEPTSETFKTGNQGREDKLVDYTKEDLVDLALAYAITIHKSQGSEFPVVIIPVLGQHFNMLFRNLIYTGLTRAKKLAIFIGSRRALTLAVRQIDSRNRQTALSQLVSAQLGLLHIAQGPIPSRH